MPRLELRIREVDIEAGAKSKGSNGGVAVGLPHRNYSVFKQTHINEWKVKGRDPPSAVGGLRGIYKRGGSRGKKVKAHGPCSMGRLFLHDERQAKRPTQRSGVGLKALIRGLGVGGRKRKQKQKV